ncbi:MAG: transposase family protein [Rubrivivax sp.]|nr:transposase family protein [Rubrivivax sp.]
MLTATEHDILGRAREELQRAPHGKRKPIVERTAAALQCSVQTAYRKLGEAGFASGRKQRSDARTCVLPEEQISMVAGVLRASLNKKGQRMPVRTALDMLHASGQLNTQVHESTVSRQLYARRLHPEQMALAEPSVKMRSLHPNHVWQVDSTTGAYYYLPGGRLRWMPEDQFYKNKVANLVKASTDLLTRYAAADHFSHAFKCRYYLGGETAENLLDFVTWAMWKQDSNPMHGVPLMLYMDKGGANRGHLMRNFCERTGIHLDWHAQGNARATGSVEKVHDLARMFFETRFRFRDPADVTLDKLNADIEAWAAAFCATAKHSRHEQPRYSAWMSITAEQLRVPASLEALREAAVREPETRRVSNDKRITFGSPSRSYLLNLVPGIAAGLKVTVVSNPFRAPAIDVQFIDPDTGEETWHVVEPEETVAGGFPADAPVWGQDMRRAALSDVDRNRNAITRQAYRTGDGLPTVEEADKARKAHAAAYAGLVDSMADVKATQVPAYLPRRSTPMDLPTRDIAPKRLPVVEACTRLKARMGDRYPPQMYTYLADKYGSAEDPGVPEDQLDNIESLFTTDKPVANNGFTGLRAVGGGEA